MPRPTYIELQEKFGGSYVAHLEDSRVIGAATLDELISELKRAGVDLTEVEIEYVDPPDVVVIY